MCSMPVRVKHTSFGLFYLVQEGVCANFDLLLVNLDQVAEAGGDQFPGVTGTVTSDLERNRFDE